MFNKNNLKKFLKKAKINTYASKGEGAEKRLKDGGKKFEYQKGNFYYRDVYYGFNPFIGEEVVFYRRELVWAMNYYGRVIAEPVSAREIYFFLKKALKKIAENKPFRGPDKFIYSNFKYANNVVGNIEEFIGREKIYYRKKLVYLLRYHGGIVGKIILKKLKHTDKKYFAKWWRDRELLKLTSGILKRISDQEVDKYFLAILDSKTDHHFMIVMNEKTIGHISLVKSRNNWYETQIVIGNKKYLNKGIGTKAVQLLIKKAHRLGISKIYLEVRPTNIRAVKAYEKCGFEKTGFKHYLKNKFLPETIRMEFKG